MYECYNKKLLRINLTTKEIRTEEISEDLIQNYIGGMGFGVKTLYDEVDAQADALSPENKIIVSIGPITGTSAPLFAQTCIVTKSPATNGILNSYAGGHLGYRLKSSGYDAVVVEGKSDELVYVTVNNDKVEIKKCPELIGKSTDKVETFIKEKENNDDMSIMSVGLAGENKVRFAAVITETRAFGRGGPGAVFGSKNLKAIAFSGDKDILVNNTDKFSEIVDEFFNIFKKSIENEWSLLGIWSKNGTGAGMPLINDRNALATKNHQYGHFEKAADIDGYAYIKKYPSKKIACFGCPIHCGQVHKFTTGDFKGMVTRGPEYETMYSFGSDCLIDDLDVVAKAHQICEDYGMDTLSAGCTMAFAMECYEKGLITKEDTGGIELDFGDGKAMLSFLEKTARREDIGDLFADGTKRAAESLGNGAEHFAMNVKGLEFAAWMPQRMRGIALTFATSNRGACHKRAPIGDELMEHIPMEAIEGKAQVVKDIQDKVNAIFTLVGCRFVEFEVSLGSFVELLKAASGMDYTEEEFIKVGEKIWNLERLFNLNSGMTKIDDDLPGRCFDALPVGDGFTQMKREELEFMIQDYYKLRGWDKEGRPTKEKLIELGVELLECSSS